MKMPPWAGLGLSGLIFLLLISCAAPAPRTEPGARPPVHTDERAATVPTDSGWRDVSALLEEIRMRYELPALGAALVRSDGLIAFGVTGVRRNGDPTPVAPDDPFHIGSCCKSMTATVVARLVEQGVLSWDTTLGEVFGEQVPDLHADYRPVTLWQLVRHHGGAPQELTLDGLWGRLLGRAGSPTDQRLDLVRTVLSNPPAVTPGTQPLYANAGYTLVGAVAEARTGVPWEELVQRLLCEPLGITTAGFGAPGTLDGVNAPWGHRRLSSNLMPMPPSPLADNPPALAPAGTMHLSLPDWARFVALHLAAYRADSRETLLSPGAVRSLHEPFDSADGSFAAGWAVTTRPWGGGTVLTHAGTNTLWFAVVWLAPQRDIAVLVATNLGGDEAPRACDDAAAALLRLWSVELLAARGSWHGPPGQP